MKRLLLLLIVSFLASAALAMQVDGYYINANNDTIKAKSICSIDGSALAMYPS
jgi:hypothetical protein